MTAQNTPPRAHAAARYRLERKVAQGGMGVVHAAYDTLAQRQVAHKRLVIQEDAGRERRLALFQREYDTLAQLRHPNIVETYEYGNDEGGPYYTMELLSGRDLSTLAPLPVRDVCRIAREIASALALVHARGYVHRDVSPSNVRLTTEGRAKLFDFGALTDFGPTDHYAGTVAFMAPECLTDAPLDQRTDLYSLGALIYWTLTRRQVTRARTVAELAAKPPAPPPPSVFEASIPRALDELTLSLLALDPLARPSSAAEVIERLNAIGQLEPAGDERQAAYGYLAHPRLVGRREIMARLGECLARASQGAGSTILLEAASGQGRSALLDAITRKAQLAGLTVLRANASIEAGGFGVALAVSRSVDASHPDLVRDRALRDSALSWLLRVDPSPMASAWSPVRASERKARLVTGMRDLVIAACRRNPVVLVLDEVHAADPESLAWLSALTLEAPELPLVVLASAESASAWRNEDLKAGIAARAERHELGPLSESEVVELVAAVFGKVPNGHRLARWLFAQSGGNPARCMDLARALLQRGLIHYASGLFSLPHDIAADWAEGEGAAPILTRIRDLSPTASQLVDYLCVQELPLALDTLTRASGAPPRTVVLALDELLARQLVSVQGQGYALASRSLATALERALPDSARRLLHERSARVLLQEGDAGDPKLRLQAGVHLLRAGLESEAAALLTPRSDSDWLAGDTPTAQLEAVLEIERKRGVRDEHCLRLLVPLVRSGFFGELATQHRHLDRTLAALARVTGIDRARRWAPRLGPKLALICGVLLAVVRHAFTPKRRRFGSFEQTFAALLSILSSTVAAATSAFDPREATRIVGMFEILSAFGADSAPALSIEFCRAVADLACGRIEIARTRFRRLLARFERPVKGMDDTIHLQFKLGLWHGLAQCEVMFSNPLALELADKLSAGHRFFAPHAETIRMGFHALRGERELAAQCRARGEVLALHGGISWSAVTIMIMRALYGAIQTADAVEIARLVPELERMAKTAPKLLRHRDSALAYLELARGRPEQAVEAYERLFAQPEVRDMMTWPADRAQYARALSALKRYRDAEQVCATELAEITAAQRHHMSRVLKRQLALARLGQGDLKGARTILETMLQELAPRNNPLWLGEAHCDLARVAMAAGEEVVVTGHLRAAIGYFQQTKNPVLIQQVGELIHAAKARFAHPNLGSGRLTGELELGETAIGSVDPQPHPLTRAAPSPGGRGSG